jgi:cytochrome c oxidase cbb3-type subunit IV
MDINDLRSIVTVLSALAFAGIVAWTLSRRNKPQFDEAAMLPFADSDAPPTGNAAAPRDGGRA